ncbi:hypothetical protein [Actinoplanes sp. NPDC049118]|uniref:hypothetical protein n=1 Tax=Actinoplanes sp. NPDC049118 TaxID=3155769 RepID=UPI0033C88584
MLNINPKMLGRLAELEEDLQARRSRAEAEGWAGEIEGIDLTLRPTSGSKLDGCRSFPVPSLSRRPLCARQPSHRPDPAAVVAIRAVGRRRPR